MDRSSVELLCFKEVFNGRCRPLVLSSIGGITADMSNPVGAPTGRYLLTWRKCLPGATFLPPPKHLSPTVLSSVTFLPLSLSTYPALQLPVTRERPLPRGWQALKRKSAPPFPPRPATDGSASAAPCAAETQETRARRPCP